MIGMNHHSMITTRSKAAKQQQEQQEEQQDHSIELCTILRIRPLLTKEKDDHVVLQRVQKKKQPATVVLHPLPPNNNNNIITSPGSIQQGHELTFCTFSKVLDTSSSQESVFYATGLTLATECMEPLVKKRATAINHVLFAMGLAESGKTHTLFGKDKDAGLLPRILESLYSQYQHHAHSGNSSFGVRLGMLLLTQDKETVVDLLNLNADASNQKSSGVKAMVASMEKTPTKTSANDNILLEQHADSGNTLVKNANIQLCKTLPQAMQVLHNGLSKSTTHSLLTKAKAKGHVLVTIQPVRGAMLGGCLTVVDLLAPGNAKHRTSSTKDATPRNQNAHKALLHCLQTLQHNANHQQAPEEQYSHATNDDEASEISCVSEPKLGQPKPVPWKQSKLTMLLRPLVNQRTWWGQPALANITKIILILHVYPGQKDYADKLNLLQTMEKLVGVQHPVETGLPPQQSFLPQVRLSYSQSDDEEEYTTNVETKENQAPQPSAPVDFPGVALFPPSVNPNYVTATKSNSMAARKLALHELRASKQEPEVLDAGKTNAFFRKTNPMGPSRLEPATTLSKTLQEPKRPQPTGRPTTTRLSTEFQVEPEAHHAAHRQRIQELEDQNAVLVERNMMLEQNVQELQQKTQRLQKELREARRSARQVEWTAQEEQEWHTSRRLRRQEQDLIKSPLKQHLTKVEDTFQINHRWLVESGKPHYALSYPKWWTGAKELDARDHSLALEPHHELGGEKRKTNPHLDQYKRLKKY